MDISFGSAIECWVSWGANGVPEASVAHANDADGNGHERETRDRALESKISPSGSPGTLVLAGTTISFGASAYFSVQVRTMG